MYFNLESDTGDKIVGYVVPDSFSGVPSIRVCSDGAELLVFTANEVREGVVTAGRHETGSCGFRIDTEMLPALPNLEHLELFDVESGILIYRRPKMDAIRKKILRLETHLLPMWRLDSALEPRFQYFAQIAEKYGRESVTQMFLLNFIDSVYVSARILYKNYAYYIEEAKFGTVILLQEPYEEMAERLMVLSRLGDSEIEQLGMLRDSTVMRSAIEFAKGLPLQNERALIRALRSMPNDVAATFANPILRQLTTSTPDEMPSGGAVATALDLLSSFALVGLRHESPEFLRALGELLGVEAPELPPIPHFPFVSSLAKILKASKAVDALIEKDVELYQIVAAAHKKAL
jgi:hypothetical protein